MNRRGFLIGAAFAPAGVAISKELAAQLALPAPEPPKTGETLKLLTPQRHGAVMYLSDLRDCNASLTLLNDDGSVAGTYAVVELMHSMHMSEVSVARYDDMHYRSVYGRPSLEIEMRLRQIG